MEKRILIFCITIILILLNPFVFSQTEEYFLKMDKIFKIPSEKITTGVLMNRAPQLIDMKTWYLQTEQDSVKSCNPNNWLMLYYTLYAAHLTPRAFGYDLNIYKEYPKQVYRNETVPLGFLFYNYNKIREDAVETGLIMVDSIQQMVTDISGRGTPLEIACALAFSALTDSLEVGSYTFVLPESLFVSNQTHAIDALYIDFGDGQGFIPVSQNNPISIYYNTVGKVTLTLQAVINAQDYFASTEIYLTAPSKKTIDEPPCILSAYEVISNNVTIKAYYGIWYNTCDNCTEKKIRKPIIIASGFDPMNNNRIYDEESFDDKKSIYLYNVANRKEPGETKGFLDKLREYGYDIIIWRSKNSTESISRNADNLIEFIKYINDLNTTDNELIIYGASMGGLIVRYALTKMEYDGDNHKTKLFISMDSPQEGANVLLGFQYMGMFLKTLAVGALDEKIDKALNCDAAIEMLLYHHTATDLAAHKAYPSPKRTAYINNLASMGDLPKKTVNMAISLGSGISANQGFNPGQRLVTKYSTTFSIGAVGFATVDVLLTIIGIPGGIGGLGAATLSSLKLEFYVNAVTDHSDATIFDHEVSLNICVPTWNMAWFPIPIPGFTLDCSPELWSSNVKVNNTVPIDNAPGSKGGYHNLKALLTGDAAFLTNPIIEKILLNMNVDQNYDCFIPSYSALGLKNLANTPHTNIKNYLNNQSGVTQLTPHFYKNENLNVSSFDYLYIEDENDFHIYNPDTKEGVFSAELIMTIDEMVSREYLYLKDRTIKDGEKVAYEATKEIEVDGNFVVNSGGTLTMHSEQIVLKPGFHAEEGSNVHLSPDVDWVCIINTVNGNQNTPNGSYSPGGVPDFITSEPNEEKNISHSESIKIFPNPVNEILTIELPYLNEKTNIAIYGINGNLLFEKEYFETSTININFTNYQPGIYIVRINNSAVSSVGKVIKQ